MALDSTQATARIVARKAGRVGLLRRIRGRSAPLYAVFALQLFSAMLYIGELWTEILGLRTFATPWVVQEYNQMLASVALLVGVAMTLRYMRENRKRLSIMERQVDVASGNYQARVEAQFDAWNLSASEREVAIYAMKGFSNAEIADLRETAESTVKSQMNAVYRKTGLGNRQQLISYLVEDLLVSFSDAPDAERPQ